MRNRILKAILLTALVLLLVSGTAFAEAATSGKDGDISWTYSNGVLTFSGTGEMSDEYNPSWYWWRSEVTSVVIKKGVTSIPEKHFHDCSFTSITIPASVTSIEKEAFYYCRKLKSIVIPGSVKYIGSSAFFGCDNLESVTLNEGLEQIRASAFMCCPKLKSLQIPGTVNSIGYMVFYQENKTIDLYFRNKFPDNVDTGMFYGATVNAYYPSSWTPVFEDNYWGHATWIPVDMPSIRNQPDTVMTYQGMNAEYKVTAEGANLSYQWMVSTDNLETWKKSGLDGNKTNKLTLEALQERNGYIFKCVITDGVGQSVESLNAGLYIMPSDVYISQRPASVTVNENKTASFHVGAGSSMGYALNYQWQASTDNGKTWNNSGLTGNKTDTLKVDATLARNGYKFRCVVSNEWGDCINSPAATLTVKQVIKVNSYSLNQKVTKASNVKFRVGAESLTGSTLSYQWQASTDGGKTFKNSGLTGSKTAILTVGATAARNGYRFRCVITDAKGNTVTTAPAVLTVASASSGKVTLSHITAGQSAVAGTTVRYTVLAKTTTNTELSYQWQVSTDGGKTFKNSSLSGNKTTTLKVDATAARNNYQFRCVVTDAKGNKITSDASKLTVTAK